jgi:hypothetical protein
MKALHFILVSLPGLGYLSAVYSESRFESLGTVTAPYACSSQSASGGNVTALEF